MPFLLTVSTVQFLVRQCLKLDEDSASPARNALRDLLSIRDKAGHSRLQRSGRLWGKRQSNRWLQKVEHVRHTNEQLRNLRFKGGYVEYTNEGWIKRT